jgi:hypothetical protein
LARQSNPKPSFRARLKLTVPTSAVTPSKRTAAPIAATADWRRSEPASARLLSSSASVMVERSR